MAIKREEAALRLRDRTGDGNDLCADCCAWRELHGVERAVVSDRLAQLRREFSSDAEIVDVISEAIVIRAEPQGYLSCVGTSARHALCVKFRIRNACRSRFLCFWLPCCPPSMR